jgi:hypothetical protein
MTAAAGVVCVDCVASTVAQTLVFSLMTIQESFACGEMLHVVSPLHREFAGQLHAKLSGIPSWVYRHSVPASQPKARRLTKDPDLLAEESG